MTQEPVRSPSRRTISLIVGMAIFFAVAFLLSVWKPWAKRGDPIAATAANAKGVGYLEQFFYPEAAAEFEKAVALAPDWLPARINLGMALYNSASGADDPVLPKAIAVFEDVLQRDPNNLYAHFNLGIIKKYRGDFLAAAEHFRVVVQNDPTDDRAWLYLGQSDPEMLTSVESKKHFEKALELNPYLIPARYAIANHLLTTPEQQSQLHTLNEKLRLANWEDEARPDRHSEQGRYATAIGRGLSQPAGIGPLPVFDQVSRWTISNPPTWATDDSKLRVALNERFGRVMVLFDFNHDGRPDVLLLSAVIRNGVISDLLLRNDGNDFTDISAEVGLDGPGSIAAAVGDYDNDGWPDLVLSHSTGLTLLRNEQGKRFSNQTTAAAFDKQSGIYLSLTWLDIDQDGDLDLIAGRYAKDLPTAVASLTNSAKADLSGRLVVFQNSGVAPPSRADEPTPPLTTKFKVIDDPVLATPGAIIGVIAADLDGDKDVDLIVLRDRQKPAVIFNDRLMRFHAGTDWPPDDGILGGVILDANGDEQSDFVFTSRSAPRVHISKQDRPSADLANRFADGATDSPPLRSAWRCDLDADGRADIVGVTFDHRPIFLQGDGHGKFTHRADAFGPAAVKSQVHAAAIADMNGDGESDLILWTGDGITVLTGLGNGNRTLRLAFTGKRDNNNAGSGQKNLRTNADGIGTKFQVLTGALLSHGEWTTRSTGPGQSLLPFEVGIGRAEQADTIRIRWPDCVVQAELGLPANRLNTISELNRKPTSCPVLMTWDGSKWCYITDFLGGGALGESGADGSTRPPRPEESLKIEAHQLGLKEGRYVIRIAEPMDEMMYLDHVTLAVIDHPAGAEVYPDERFAVANPQPTQALLRFMKTIAPTKAVDHRGIDRTKTVARHDNDRVDGFAKRSWLGFADEHVLEFEFGDAVKSLSSGSQYLILAGWTDYPYPESIVAAGQAGVEMLPPVLERNTGHGWEKLADIGFPAGLPKVMTVPVNDWFRASKARFRIRTNLQIYWDRIALGTAETISPVALLTPSQATLSHPGFVQEIGSGGSTPQAYDPNRFEPVAVSSWPGPRTKHGDVTELISKVDDRFVLCGPGEEVTIAFDASKLSPVRDGWVRSFVLRTYGYCKDTSPTTVTGGEVLPLPFRAMTEYPPKR